jgi:ribosomal protein S18 acetylase RimI-like enzyme
METTGTMPDDITIRNLRESDYIGLLEMYRNFQPKNYIMGLPPPVEPLRIKWLQKLLHEKFNLIAERGGEILGHASIIDVPGGDFCELIVFIHQDYRGMRIGTGLTEEICQRAMYLGRKKIWLMVESNNIQAVKMYYKIGFRVTRMYGDVYEMELDIKTPADYMAK